MRRRLHVLLTVVLGIIALRSLLNNVCLPNDEGADARAKSLAEPTWNYLNMCSQNQQKQDTINGKELDLRVLDKLVPKLDTEAAVLPVVDKSDLTLKENWIILMTLNDGYFDVFENWWYHYNRLNMDANLTLVAEDDNVYEKLSTLTKHKPVTVVRSTLVNMTDSVKFNSVSYKTMVSQRPSYILSYLEKGANVLYSDSDAIWLQDPFPYFVGLPDMWTQYETPTHDVNTGFLAIRHTKNSLTLMERWRDTLNKKIRRNQGVLNEVINRTVVDITHLDVNKFVEGPVFSRMSRGQRLEVVMLHATYCFGHDAKIGCFKKWNVWHRNLNSDDELE